MKGLLFRDGQSALTILNCGSAFLFVFSLSQVCGHCAAFYTTVQIAAWTTTGDRIENARAELKSVMGNETYDGTGKLVKLFVPTGEYVLEVSAPGFQKRRQILQAYQPRVFRSVALPIVPVDPSMMSGLTGRVRNYKGDLRNLRVRLMGLYGTELQESIPDERGSFTFPADEGAYLLLIVADVAEGPSIIDLKPMRIVGNQTVTIDLKGRLGELILRHTP